MTTIAAIMPARVANPCHGDDGTATVSLAYDPADPYAVTMTIYGYDVEIEWRFARELLAAGLVRPAGYGDVTVWPGNGYDVEIGIVLTSPDGQCLVELPRVKVTRFLHRTDDVVPFGEESMDFDAELAAFLDGVR